MSSFSFGYLVSVPQTSATAGRVRQKNKENHLAEESGVEDKTFYVSKKIFKHSQFYKNVLNKNTIINKRVEQWTSDVGVRGKRLLLPKNSEQYETEVGEAVNEFRKARKEFADNLFEEVQKDKETLKGEFNLNDYPSYDDVMSWDRKMEAEPIPEWSDLSQIPQQYIDGLEKRHKEMEEAMRLDILDRIKAVVSAAIENVESSKMRKDVVSRMKDRLANISNLAPEDWQEIREIINKIVNKAEEFDPEIMRVKPETKELFREKMTTKCNEVERLVNNVPF